LFFEYSVDPSHAPALFVSMAKSPEVERARRALSGVVDDPTLPLPPLDSMAVSVLVIRTLSNLGSMAIMSVEESSSLIAPWLQEKSPSDVVWLSTMGDVLRNMPAWRYSMLGLLLRYLCRLASFSAKSSAGGLARSIAPVLFRPEKLRFSQGAHKITAASVHCFSSLIQ
jgi:hypothetical protein